TDLNFPRGVISLGNLPQNLVNQAAQMVAAAGITDPTLAADAEYDYLATGDPSFINAYANQQQLGGQLGFTTATVANIIQATPPPVAVGIGATQASVVEANGGTTAVTFTVYLTHTTTTDTTVNYAVLAPGAGYLSASNFGGTLPSGQVIIAAGGS